MAAVIQKIVSNHTNPQYINLISGSSASPSTLVCFNSSTSFFSTDAASTFVAWNTILFFGKFKITITPGAPQYWPGQY